MPDEWPELTIGEVARRAGIATSAIRYYESLGLLDPAQRVSGQRRYAEDVLGRLAFIGVAQSAGFTLSEVRELLRQGAHDEDLGGPMRLLSKRKLPEVTAAVERASAMQRWLQVASDCTCPSPDECRLFPHPGDEPFALDVVTVSGEGCRRTR